MMYAFCNGQLVMEETSIYPGDVPPKTYVYIKPMSQWVVRLERSYFRPVKPKHVPKELKMLCLLLGI